MQTVRASGPDVIVGLDARFTRHRGPVTCVTCVPGSDAAVTSGYDGAVAWVDLAAGRLELLGYHDHLVNRISVNAAGTKAASSSSDYSVYLWDLTTRSVERVLLGHSDDVEDFVFVDDHTGVSVSRDSRLLVWNLDTGAITRVIEGHDKDALSVDFFDGRIFSSGDDMTLRVWDLAEGSLVRKWGPFAYETDTCAVDPGRNRVILGCDDGRLRAFDIVTGAPVAEIEAHASGIKKVAVSPKSGEVLSVGYDQQAFIWHAADFTRRISLDTHPAVWERSFNWAHDGERLVAGTFDGTVIVWDAVSGAVIDEIGDRGPGNPCLNDVAATATGFIPLTTVQTVSPVITSSANRHLAQSMVSATRFTCSSCMAARCVIARRCRSAKVRLMQSGFQNTRTAKVSSIVHVTVATSCALRQTVVLPERSGFTTAR